jgi:AcrR family transcriptional regulator
MHSTPAGGAPPEPPSERCPRLTQGARCNHAIEAAICLFAQKGFQGTKTREIAEAAGVNEALIFRDFRSKEKLYCAILDYASQRIHTERWIEELSPYAAQRKDEAVFSRLALKIVEAFGREQTLFRLMLYSALEQHDLARKFRERQIEPLECFLQNYVKTRQGEGVFRHSEPRAVALSFLSMCHHHVLRQILFGDQPPDRDAVKTFTHIFLDGIRSH